MEINGTSVNESVRYAQLDLSPALMRAIEKKGYVQATPVQAGAIPYFMEWKDVIAKAPTGTGKTLAFGIPLIEHCDAEKPDIQSLILAPTRELATQICEDLKNLTRFLPQLRVVVVYGGQSMERQKQQLKKGAHILVATPGRLLDLMQHRAVSLKSVTTAVLDEADRMLDMGFVHDVKKVIAKLPAQRQNLMFSATMPAEIEQLAAGILHDPAFVKVDPVSSTVDRIQQSLYYVEKGNKKLLLPWLIKNLQPPVVNALVFSRTKHGADKIAKDLNKQGIPAAAIHGNKSQSARVAALEAAAEEPPSA